MPTAKRPPRRPDIRTEVSTDTVDARAFARQVVVVALETEGIAVKPSTKPEA